MIIKLVRSRRAARPCFHWKSIGWWYYLEEPTDSRLQLEERIDAEYESVHAGQMGHACFQLVHLAGEFGVQGQSLDGLVASVGVLTIL